MRILITGGAGFIGCNTAAKYMREGHKVTILDNLSRKGSEKNLEWLRTQGDFKFIKMNLSMLWPESFDVVFHFAAQVAVTASIINPTHDFIVNAEGTLNLLDAIQRSGQNPIFIYSSTNKVYGSLEGIKVPEKGITEKQLLDFHSPYGCSKGCADQYVRDFARIYNMKTVVLRQSCIYGPHQFGIEDQGWLAWFIIAHLLNKPITVYGNGRQVRDVLYINDLLDCYDKVIENADVAKGEIYNVGGGPENQLSLLEFFDILSDLSGNTVKYGFEKARKADQKIYVSDITKIKNALNWYPRISVKEGILQLYNWIKERLC